MIHTNPVDWVGPRDSTLPVIIYSAIRKGLTPEINAISTIIISISLGLMLIAARLSNWGGERFWSKYRRKNLTNLLAR